MKKTALIILLTACVVAAQAQFNTSLRGNNQSPGNKIYVGGGGGFGTGTDINGFRYTYFSLLPIIGYRIDEQYSVGATITYQRYNYSNTPIGSYSFTQYGFGPFVRYTVNPLFFQVEYDMINAPAYNSNGEIVRSNYSRFLVGVGYLLPLGKRSAVNAMAMYDLLYKTPSVFNSPLVLRVYFVF